MGAVLTELDLRRKNCTKCKRWKLAIEFPWRWKSRGRALAIPYIHSVCSSCKTQKERERYDALTPEEKRAKGKKANRQAYERRHKLNAQVVKLKTRVETLEERLDKYRKRVGIAKRTYDNEILLDIVPIRMFLIKQARISSMKSIARQVGVDESLVRRHVQGFYWESSCDPRPVRTVTLSTVDKYLVRLNAEQRLDDMYPEIDDLLEEHLRTHPS
jgi:hypothetical protein